MYLQKYDLEQLMKTTKKRFCILLSILAIFTFLIVGILFLLKPEFEISNKETNRDTKQQTERVV